MNNARTLFLVVILFLCSTGWSQGEGLTTDTKEGVVLAEYLSDRIQWKVLISPGGSDALIDEVLSLVVEGDNLAISCTVENLDDPEAPLRDVRIEVLPPQKTAGSDKRVARSAGPGQTRSARAEAMLGLQPLPDPDVPKESQGRVVKGSRSVDQAAPTADESVDADREYRVQLRASSNAGFALMEEAEDSDQGLGALTIINPTAQGTWRLRVTGGAGERFIIVGRVMPVEMTGADIDDIVTASQALEEAVGSLLGGGDPSPTVDQSSPDGRKVAKGSRVDLGFLKCSRCCYCDRLITLTGLTAAFTKVFGKKAIKELGKNPTLRKKFKARLRVLIKEVAGLLGVSPSSAGWASVAVLLDRDPLCFIRDSNKLLCCYVPKMADTKSFCDDPCPPDENYDNPFDQPDEPVGPDVDQDWTPVVERWQKIQKGMTAGQTLTVGVRGTLREIELGVHQSQGGARSDLTVQIRRVDRSRRPGLESTAVLCQRYVSASVFSQKDERRLAAVDLSSENIQVFPGDQLAITVTNRSNDGLEWSEGDGYEGGRGFVMPAGSGGWTDRPGDFMFRTYVTPSDTAASGNSIEWVPVTRKSAPIWNRNTVVQTFVVTTGGIVEAVELGIYRTKNVRERIRLELLTLDASGLPSDKSILHTLIEPDLFPPEGDEAMAFIDLSGEHVVVEPGQRLAIALTNRSSDPYEWSYLDGYADGQGYVESTTMGWMDWKCDFSFRVHVAP